jgi:hypothetical protein
MQWKACKSAWRFNADRAVSRSYGS